MTAVEEATWRGSSRRQVKPKEQEGRAKQPTLAGLAAQQATMQERMASLVDQIQVLTQKQSQVQQHCRRSFRRPSFLLHPA